MSKYGGAAYTGCADGVNTSKSNGYNQKLFCKSGGYISTFIPTKATPDEIKGMCDMLPIIANHWMDQAAE